MTTQTNAATAGDAQLVGTSGRPAIEGKPRIECGHWIGGERRHCKEADGIRLYIPGHRCPLHTPAALQGKPENQPGPGWPIDRQEAS